MWSRRPSLGVGIPGHLAAGGIVPSRPWWPAALICCVVHLHENSCRHLGHPPSGGGSLPERPRPGASAGQKKIRFYKEGCWLPTSPARPAVDKPGPGRLGRNRNFYQNLFLDRNQTPHLTIFFCTRSTDPQKIDFLKIYISPFFQAKTSPGTPQNTPRSSPNDPQNLPKSTPNRPKIDPC